MSMKRGQESPSAVLDPVRPAPDARRAAPTVTTQRAQPSAPRRPRPRRALSERWAIAAIVVLPFLQWLLYDPKNGMPYETALITTSRARGFFGGFLYVGDPMRPFTSFWYHVGEMLSHVPGMIGSYLGIQIVFLTLWCLRNVL